MATAILAKLCSPARAASPCFFHQQDSNIMIRVHHPAFRDSVWRERVEEGWGMGSYSVPYNSFPFYHRIKLTLGQSVQALYTQRQLQNKKTKKADTTIISRFKASFRKTGGLRGPPPTT
jgi:hypothetical protein